MPKTIAWISLGAALCWVPLSAHAQTGYGVKPGRPSTSTFDRSWNRANESKDRRELAQSISVAAAHTTIRITTTLSERSRLFARSQTGLCTPALDSATADPIERRRAFRVTMGS